MMTMTPVKQSAFNSHLPDLDVMVDDTKHWNPYHYRPLRRDSQRRRVYEAGWAFKKECAEKMLGNRQMAEFLGFVSSDKWFTDRFGVRDFGVQFSGRRTSSAVCEYRLGEGFTLKFPAKGSMNYRLTALHELMHIVCHRQSHGPIFCAAFLQVVMHYMGFEAGQVLRRQFVLNGVRFRP
jgi:putative metallohydrolase (TIGR04338 family)